MSLRPCPVGLHISSATPARRGSPHSEHKRRSLCFFVSWNQPFDLNFLTTETGHLIPVDLSMRDCAVRQPGSGFAFEFAPPSVSICSLEPADVTDSVADSNRLHLLNLADDLCHILPRSLHQIQGMKQQLSLNVALERREFTSVRSKGLFAALRRPQDGDVCLWLGQNSPVWIDECLRHGSRCGK